MREMSYLVTFIELTADKQNRVLFEREMSLLPQFGDTIAVTAGTGEALYRVVPPHRWYFNVEVTGVAVDMWVVPVGEKDVTRDSDGFPPVQKSALKLVQEFVDQIKKGGYDKS